VIEIIEAADNNNTLDNHEREMIDYISELDDEGQRIKVASGFAPGGVTYDEGNQIKFLSSLSLDEQLESIDNGSFVDTNWDDDTLGSNWFEKFVSKTPYDVKNDVHAIVMMMAGHEYEYVAEMFDILDNMKIPKENIYDICEEKNNSANFEAAVNSVAQKASENDAVMIFINGHNLGDITKFYFKDGKAVPYGWIDQQLDKINSKSMTVSVETCYAGYALNGLKDDNRIIFTSGLEDQKSSFGPSYELLRAFSNSSADTNKNNVVSMGEALIHAKKVTSFPRSTPQIIDPSNIADSTYIADLLLEN
jgi:hypothetical protein